MPGETLITESAPAAAPAAASPATAPAAGGAPAGAAPAQGQADSQAAAPGAGAAPAGGSEGADGSQPGEKSAEQKAADEAAARAAEEAAAAVKAGAPEKYEPFTPPEGTALDAEVMNQFEEAARELNLPQDKAQQLIDKMAPAMAKQQAAQVEQLRTDWAAQSTSDKEFGGDKLQENLGFARKALDSFATPELKTILNETGLGNHPELVRFMVRAGKAISPDNVVIGNATPNASRSAAEVLYGAGTAKK